ncbi:MAG: ribbon-helix-helix domain-containing protein [Bdellovibrionales bacterium]
MSYMLQAAQPPYTNGNDATPPVKEKICPRSSLVIRNVVVCGRRTSIRLEPEMWGSLQEICKREKCTAHDIATMIASAKGIGSLTAAMRVFIMIYFRQAATEDGHNRAGHGSGSVLQPLFNAIAAQTPMRRQY